jgi:hypothetical protein
MTAGAEKLRSPQRPIAPSPPSEARPAQSKCRARMYTRPIRHSMITAAESSFLYPVAVSGGIRLEPSAQDSCSMGYPPRHKPNSLANPSENTRGMDSEISPTKMQHEMRPLTNANGSAQQGQPSYCGISVLPKNCMSREPCWPDPRVWPGSGDVGVEWVVYWMNSTYRNS